VTSMSRLAGESRSASVERLPGGRVHAPPGVMSDLAAVGGGGEGNRTRMTSWEGCAHRAVRGLDR
jgi:hypothetical protein